jgi:phenylpyruvate tautomerase PptA (4-oxalocrotonate tautomerase family)
LAYIVPVDVQGKVDEALKEKGIRLDLSQITEDNLEELIEALSDLTVDVVGKEKVRIFCE